jgi:long-chain acyl-CoA synthetase
MTDPRRYEKWTSLPALFFDQAQNKGDAPLLWAKRDGAYRSQSWNEAADAIRRCALGLRTLGISRGDRVAIVSENRPEWLIADFAIMSLGAITVPAYTTSTTADYTHVLADSGAEAAIVSGTPLLRKVLPAALQAADLRTLISFDGVPATLPPGGPEVMTWADLIERGAAHAPGELEPILDAARRDDIACLIYTSGTGGTPKGVMLTHGNMLANCRAALGLILEIGIGQERFLSFLPLAHAYEHTCGQMFALSLGAEIAYAESIEKLASNLGEVRPTIMTAVPRLYEVLETRIRREVQRAGGLRQRLFERTLELGHKRYLNGGRLGPLDELADWCLGRLVRARIAERFGGRLKAFISGGAALNPEIALFFQALGVRILQGYGQTEAAPLICCNRPNRFRHETVGPPVEGVELRIAEDGEILARGPMVMKGYWNAPHATERAVTDGWLHTGDVGHIDPDGLVVLTDRKKDLIVTSGGDNIAPQRIEGMLTLEPEIGQAMVAGDHRPYLVALIVPDAVVAREWAGRHGKSSDLAELCGDAEFRKLIGEAVDRVNRCLSGLERVRRFLLIPEPFSIDNGMLTPTLKIRRHEIKRHYGSEITCLYEGG